MKTNAPIKQFLFFRRLPPHPKGEWGGLEKLMFDWFERIDHAQTDVVVIVTTGWKERFLQEARQRGLPLKVEEQPFDYFHVGPLRRFFDMLKFLNGYRPFGIVFFQAHFEEFGLPELIAASWAAKGNIFMHENTGSLKPPACTSRKYFGFIPGLGLWWQYYMFCIRFRAHVAKNILAVSQGIKDRYVSWWGYPDHKVIISYHGVDTGNFLPDTSIRTKMRQQLNFSEQDKILIAVARLTPLKRIDRAIRAFNILYQNNPDAHLVLVGAGPLEGECRQLAGSLPCAAHIHFIGHVNNTVDYLRMADIFVLSSDNEGFSIALMEAMGCGLIVVATDCPGCNEIILEGQTGFITSFSDESFAEGLSKAMGLSGQRQSAMKQLAVHTIAERFDINNNVRHLLKTIGMGP